MLWIIGLVLLVVGVYLFFKNADSPIGVWFGVFGLVFVVIGWAMPARAHDPDHPELNEWYRTLMQPDAPAVSCCGESDAYWADEVHVTKDGRTIAVITDDREDAPLHRRHVDVGTQIEVPPNKLKWDRGNPTGHGIIFLSSANYVWCYVQPGGV